MPKKATIKKKTCKSKHRFKTKQEADKFAEEYMDMVAMTFHPMVPYFCERHGIWHIGHDIFQKQEYNYGAGVPSDTYGPPIL